MKKKNILVLKTCRAVSSIIKTRCAANVNPLHKHFTYQNVSYIAINVIFF